MGTNLIDISKKLGGINAIQVEEYLNSLKIHHDKELSDIRQKIDAANSQKNKLLHELFEFQKVKKELEVKKKRLEFSKERLEQSISAIKMRASKECEELLEKARERTKSYDEKIDEANEQIRKTVSIIDAMLKKMADFVKEGKEDYDEKLTLIEKGNLSNIVPYLKKKAAKSEIPPGDETEADIKEEKKEIIDEAKEKVDNLCEIEQLKMTSDGMSMSSARTSVVDSKNELEADDETKTKLNNKVESDAGNGNPSDIVNKPIIESLWDDIDNDDISAIGNEDSKIPANPINNFNERVQPSVEEAAATFEEPTKASSLDSGSQNINKQADLYSSKDVQPKETSQKSMAIDSEINMLRNKYIVGKIAGEQLLDSMGRVIAAKNAIITLEIVDIADREGKLSELIINMVLPEMES
jgi:hypothetical protein